MPEAADNTSKFTCSNCHEAPLFTGFDTCLECSVAIAIAEDPSYIDLARKLYAGTEWLRRLEREWARQMSALTECGVQAAA